jgi:hypothetical protein
MTFNGSVGDDAKSKLQDELAHLIKEETTNERIEAIVAQIESAGKLRSKQLEFRDHDSIRESLQVGIYDREQGYEFLIGYDGEGGEDERELVHLLTTRIAHRFDPIGNSDIAQELIDNQLLESPGSLDDFQAAQNKSVDEATWLVDQIENDLESAKHSLAQIGNPSGQVDMHSEESVPGSSPFQYASNKKVVVDTGQVTSVIDSIDIQSLRSTLIEIRQRVDFQTDLLRQETMAKQTSPHPEKHVVKRLRATETQPINGTPSLPSLILIGLFSLVIGATVSVNLRPFTNLGFENTKSIEQTLGVPVVAELRSLDSNVGSESETGKIPWANRVVKIAGLSLFGIFVVVAGFVLINSEVRNSFFENPLFGCAKIIRIFAGY